MYFAEPLKGIGGGGFPNSGSDCENYFYVLPLAFRIAHG